MVEPAAARRGTVRLNPKGQAMQFVKMHGAGNDYVYVDCFTAPAPADPAGLATRIADRHRGVGGDGLVLVLPSSRADARMRMFPLETGRGVLTLETRPTGPRSSMVRVDMGEPLLRAADIPVELPAVSAESQVVDAACPPLEGPLGRAEGWWEAVGLDPRMTCVSMGNPHAIFFCRDTAAIPLETVGPRIERHPVFPQRVNVHFVEVLSRVRVRMRTWERGSGITQACGTGASAVCVAGVLTGRTDRRIVAEVPGGLLELDWAASGHVFMTGPAEEVFQGTWPEG